NPIAVSAISPDGKYLAYSDQTGTYLRLMSTGEVHSLLSKNSEVQYLNWYPDSTRLLLAWASSPTAKMGLWAMPILGGNPRQLSDEGWSGAVSPDGSQITFLKSAAYGVIYGQAGSEIWTMRSDGSGQRKIVSDPDGAVAFSSPTWSPDGRWIAYDKFRSGNFDNEAWVEVFNVERGTRSTVVNQPLLGWGIVWLPDGRLIYAVSEPPPAQNSSNFWSIIVDSRNGRPSGAPVQITGGEDFVDHPTAAAEGKKFAFSRCKVQLDVYVAEFFSKPPRLNTPRRLTLNDADDLPYDWTIDDSSVIFASNRTGGSNIFDIFTQRIEENSADMVVSGPEQKMIPRLNSDGTQIMYLVPPETQAGPQTVRLLRAPIQGGTSQVILEGPNIRIFTCSRRNHSRHPLSGRHESPDSLDLTHWPSCAHRHRERLGQSCVPRLGRRRKRIFYFQQPQRPPVHSVIRRLGRQRSFTLASQKLSGHLGRPFPQWKVPCHSRPDHRVQRLDGGKILTPLSDIEP